MISAELRETLIIATLQQLDAVHPQALSPRMLIIPLKQSGLADIDEKDLSSLLLDLEEKSWVKPKDSEAARELTRYIRTEDGRAYLRRNGF
jgi:DNA-binding PadR family transcriptional regulator